MIVGIISDGNYGERARANIEKKFPVKWILVPDIPPTQIIDEMVLPDIPACDVYISYARHPDIILQLAELQKPLLLAILPGKGLLRQARQVNPRVVGVDTMCSLEPTTSIPEIDELARHFGRPEYACSVDANNVVHGIHASRSSPCGSSVAGIEYLEGKPLTEENLKEFSLWICHECRAPRFGQTCDKEVAGLIHLMAIGKSIPNDAREHLDRRTAAFLTAMEAEYKRRLDLIHVQDSRLS
nr:DUF166 family protein [Candidatus Sigynarchaeota archaeon]